MKNKLSYLWKEIKFSIIMYFMPLTNGYKWVKKQLKKK